MTIETPSVPSFEPASVASSDAPTVSRELVKLLRGLGVEQAYGVIGGAVAAFSRAIWDSRIRYVHCRHEMGAVCSAIEASIASGRPTLVFVTGGPGVTNALTGMVAARWEGARVILVSAASSPIQRGRTATQETSAYTLPYTAFYTSGPVFHFATMMESAAELPTVAARLASGLSRTTGFVAHVGLPLSVQSAAAEELPRSVLRAPRARRADAETVAECVEMLRDGRFVIWTGFGARRASGAIRRLVEQSGAAVISSPRGKGIFPEDHPQFVGVTGLGGHPRIEAFMLRERPERVLVLGSRLGESTSLWSRSLVPTRGFIHVDVDPEAFGAAYQTVPTYGVDADVEQFVGQLLERWPRGPLPRMPPLPAKLDRVEPQPGRSPVRPQALMTAVQRVIVDGSDATVLAESGNSFLWTTHLLELREPGRYRVSTGFGSMGHVTGGVVGAALGSGRVAVAVVGDGAMLMQNEISTAVSYNVPAVWIVLNDSLYSICDQGMRSFGWESFGTELPDTDFVKLAQALGAGGVRVEREDELEPALRAALASGGPFVVDVRIDRRIPAPAGMRNQGLMAQGLR